MAQNKIKIADLNASGTPSSTTYLRGDNTWSTVSGGGGGLITGGVGGSGGVGGLPGGGAGGGGASLNLNNSGAGGVGGNGQIIVTTYF